MATLKFGVVGDSFWTAYGSGVYISDVISTYLTGLGHTVTVNNQAVSGKSSVDWQAGGSYWPSALSAFSSANITDLIYAVGINDSQNGVATTASDYQANVQGVITSAQSGISTLQRIHLIAPSYPTPGYGPTWTVDAPPRAQTYDTAQTTLAGLNTGVYALGKTIYATLRDTVSYRLSSSDLHPSSTGATWIGNTLGAEIVDTLIPTASARDSDIFDDMVSRLVATNAFTLVSYGDQTPTEGNDSYICVINPISDDELDDVAPIEIVRRVRFQVYLEVREEEPTTRVKALDRLANTVRKTLNGVSLASLTLPPLTMVRSGVLSEPRHPGQTLKLTGEFAYLIPGYGGHDDTET